MTSFKALRFAAVTLAAMLLCRQAHAGAPLLTLEGAGGKAVTTPQSKRFGAGGAGALGVYLRVAPWVLLGAKARAGALANGESPGDPALIDPGTGTFEMLSAMLRVRPFASAAQPRSALGLFLEAGGGGTVTGKLLRPSFEGGIGFGFSIGALALAPAVRYVQVVQPQDPLSSADARMLLAGVDLALLDTSQPVHVAPRPKPKPPPPRDSDGDGLFDQDDACPGEAEDKDGYQDDDGCPERDNDQDKIADADDKCPNEPEDKDGYEDDDGCPDPDNDGDGIPDVTDRCPFEAEVVNGNEDEDGCPDQGLIEMHDDRIVLEEEVLFDFERARVKHEAWPVLDAIINLYKQHPEWMKIRIEGHADQRGSEHFNQVLSERRARNVREKLIERGIPDDMIEAVGYGSTRPRDQGDDEQAYHRNRRVEFVVVARRTTSTTTAPGGPPAAGSEQPSEPASGGAP